MRVRDVVDSDDSESPSPCISSRGRSESSPLGVLQQQPPHPPYHPPYQPASLSPQPAILVINPLEAQAPSNRHAFDDFDVDSDAEPTTPNILAEPDNTRRGSAHISSKKIISVKTASNLAAVVARRRSSIAPTPSTEPPQPQQPQAPPPESNNQRYVADNSAPEELNNAHLEGMLSIFDQCDSNHDGVLTVLECREALRRFGIFLSIAEIHSLFVELEAREEASQQDLAKKSPITATPDGKGEPRVSATNVDSLLTSAASEQRNPANNRMRKSAIMLPPAIEDRKQSMVTRILNATGLGGLLRMSIGADELEGALPRELRIAIDFVQFRNLMELWQRAARFRLFETRGDELQTHIEGRRRVHHFVPDSIGMWAWHVIVLFTSLYALCGPIALNMLSNPRMVRFFAVTTAVDAFVTVIFAVDMALKFLTVVIETDEHGNRVIIDDHRIKQRYLRSVWFWVDAVSLLPLRFLFVAGGDPSYGLTQPSTGFDVCVGAGCVFGCASGSELNRVLVGATIVAHLRILKYFSHVTLFAESRLVPLNRVYVQLNMTVARGLVDLTRVIVCIHVFAVIYCTFDEQSSNQKGDNQGGVADMYMHLEVPYVRGLYLVLYIFATVGFGDVAPANDSQMIFFMVMVVFGTLVNAYLIGMFVTSVQRSDIETTERTTLVQLQSLLHYFDVPEHLANEILQFEKHILATDILRTYNSIVCDLPADLQRGIELSARLRVVSALPHFADVHNSAKLQLCNLLFGITFLPEEYVIYFGEVGEEMYFLNHGFVDVVTGTQMYLTTLKPGDYFGEMAVMSECEIPRSASVKCISYCEFYVLPKDGFLDVISRYPRLKSAIQKVADSRLKQITVLAQSVKANPCVADGGGDHHVAAPSEQPPQGVEYSFVPPASESDNLSIMAAHREDETPLRIATAFHNRSAEQSFDIHHKASVPSPSSAAGVGCGNTRDELAVMMSTSADAVTSAPGLVAAQPAPGPCLALTTANLQAAGSSSKQHDTVSNADNVSMSDWSVSGVHRASPRRVQAASVVSASVMSPPQVTAAAAEGNGTAPVALPSFSKPTAATIASAQRAEERSVKILNSSTRLARRMLRGGSQAPKFLTSASGEDQFPTFAFSGGHGIGPAQSTGPNAPGFQLASFQPSFLEATLGAGALGRKSGVGNRLLSSLDAPVDTRKSIIHGDLVSMHSLAPPTPALPLTHGFGMFDRPAGGNPFTSFEDPGDVLHDIMEELHQTTALVAEIEDRLKCLSGLRNQ